jgi:hypothetical protein
VAEKRMYGKSIGRCFLCQYCIHIYANGKMRPVETIPVMGKRKG